MQINNNSANSFAALVTPPEALLSQEASLNFLPFAVPAPITSEVLPDNELASEDDETINLDSKTEHTPDDFNAVEISQMDFMLPEWQMPLALTPPPIKTSDIEQIFAGNVADVEGDSLNKTEPFDAISHTIIDAFAHTINRSETNPINTAKINTINISEINKIGMLKLNTINTAETNTIGEPETITMSEINTISNDKLLKNNEPSETNPAELLRDVTFENLKNNSKINSTLEATLDNKSRDGEQNNVVNNILFPELSRLPAIKTDASSSTNDILMVSLTDLFANKMLLPNSAVNAEKLPPAFSLPSAISAETPIKTQLVEWQKHLNGFINEQNLETFTAKIKVFPPELGCITAKIDVNKGSAQISLTTENSHVKQLMELNLQQLRDTFQNASINLTDVTIHNNSSQGRDEAFKNQMERENNPRQSEAKKEALGLVEENYRTDSIIDTYA